MYSLSSSFDVNLHFLPVYGVPVYRTQGCIYTPLTVPVPYICVFSKLKMTTSRGTRAHGTHSKNGKLTISTTLCCIFLPGFRQLGYIQRNIISSHDVEYEISFFVISWSHVSKTHSWFFALLFWRNEIGWK